MERYSPALSLEALVSPPTASALPHPEHTRHDELPAKVEPSSSCTYETAFGSFSFVELVEHTRNYAAFALRYTYQVNEADIDDGLQAGCLRLWQRLEEQPNLLRDKSLAWIGKGVIYTALHATRGSWQFRQKTHANGVQAWEQMPRASHGGWAAHSWESRQTDIRIDLHRAIQVVAERILTDEKGKRRDHDLWALYGLTMLQTSANEVSRLFGVREQSMQAAYTRVRQFLQEALPNYAPVEPTKPYAKKGREALPRQDMAAIRKANGDVPDGVYETVKVWIERTCSDTWKQDVLALEGIRQRIPAPIQARTFGVSQWKMQRAYDRVHLLIGAERDPTVLPRRPEHRTKSVFTLTETTAVAVEQLALALLKQPKSYEKLVALHAHIGNLPISTTAKHFNIPTSTLRYYMKQIGSQLGTPMQSAREAALSRRI